MKTFSLGEAEDKLIGKKLTPARNRYELELKKKLKGTAQQQKKSGFAA